MSATPTTTSQDEAGLVPRQFTDGPRITITSPRHKRALVALWRGPARREALDRITGCSNSPDLIAALRKKGLEIPCAILTIRDRDGRLAHPGEYSLSVVDRFKVARVLDVVELVQEA